MSFPMAELTANSTFPFFSKSTTMVKAGKRFFSSGQGMKDRTAVNAQETGEASLHLLKKVGGGSDAAFRELVALWEKPLLAFFYRQTGDYHEAQDLAQNVFRRVFRSASSFRGEGSARAWLFCLARRVLLNHWRTRKRKGFALPGDEFLHEVVPLEESGDRKAREEEELFQKFLFCLPEKQRTAMLLRVREEMDYDSIAEVLGESLANTKVLLHRARGRLRELYEKESER